MSSTKIILVLSHKRTILIITIAIFLFFTLFASLFSLHIPSWDEPDGWYHWIYSWAVFKGEVPTYLYENRHPPLYYIPNGLLLHFLDPEILLEHGYSHNPSILPFRGIDLAVHFLRFFSIGCGVVSLIFILKTSRRIFPNNTVLQLSTVSFVAFTPHFIFVNSILTNESLTITLSTISFYFLISFAKNHNARYVILLSVFTGLALLTKITAIFLIPTIFFSLIYFLLKEKNHRCFFSMLFLFLVFLIVGGGWWYFVHEASLPQNSQTQIIESILTYQSVENNKINSGFSHVFDYKKIQAAFTQILFPPVKTSLVLNDFLINIFQISVFLSVVGVSMLFLVKRTSFQSFLDGKYLVIIALSVVFIILFFGLHVFNTNRLWVRNILPAISGFSFFYVAGIFSLLNTNRLKLLRFLIFVPIIIFITSNIMIIFALSNQYPLIVGDPIHDANRFLEVQMWSGDGTIDPPFPAIVETRSLETDNSDNVAILHPPIHGKRWLNFTMYVPETNYDLGVYYGFLRNSNGRTLPVEYSIYVNDDLVHQDLKAFTGEFKKFTYDLSNYSGKEIKISLATDAKDTSIYKAWSAFKLRFEK